MSGSDSSLPFYPTDETVLIFARRVHLHRQSVGQLGRGPYLQRPTQPLAVHVSRRRLLDRCLGIHHTLLHATRPDPRKELV